jgi:hypothetical protein
MDVFDVASSSFNGMCPAAASPSVCDSSCFLLQWGGQPTQEGLHLCVADGLSNGSMGEVLLLSGWLFLLTAHGGFSGVLEVPYVICKLWRFLLGDLGIGRVFTGRFLLGVIKFWYTPKLLFSY